METQNGYVQAQTLDEAIDRLPQPYAEIDEEFLRKHKGELDVLRSIFEEKGGIHLVDVGGENACICRVPAREIITRIARHGQAGGNRSDPLALDLELVRLCLLYPKFESSTFASWIAAAPGFPSAVAKKLLEIAKVTSEATAKKL